jgi:hypothetical protein
MEINKHICYLTRLLDPLATVALVASSSGRFLPRSAAPEIDRAEGALDSDRLPTPFMLLRIAFRETPVRLGIEPCCIDSSLFILAPIECTPNPTDSRYLIVRYVRLVSSQSEFIALIKVPV